MSGERRITNPFEKSEPSPVEPQIWAHLADILRAEHQRLENDCVEAFRLGDYDKLDRLMIFSVVEIGASTADHVGWVGSFVPELYQARLDFDLSDVET